MSNPLQYSCLENPMDGGYIHAEVFATSKVEEVELHTAGNILS